VTTGVAEVPPGFRALLPSSGFIEANGPLFVRREQRDGAERVQIGFRVEQRHCNPLNNCHGGMLATFCDMLLPLSIHRQDSQVGHRFLITVNLQMDYLSSAPLGAWVQGEVEVLRVTRTMVFAQGLVTADDVPAVRTSGIFKIGQPFTGAVDPIG
jgi:uncharacterized protein (TIGR00369 family)